MLKSIYKIALRNLLRKNSHGLTNIMGLAIGISSSLLIIMYCLNELSFDAMHPYAENTYRLGYAFETEDGSFSGAFPGGPAGADNYIMDTYPSVTKIAAFDFYGMPTSLKHEPTEKIVLTEDLIWAEPNINELMYMDVLQGNPDALMPQVNSIVLTKSGAESIFGDQDPMGQIVSASHMFATDSAEVNLLVTAVIDDLPANSHIRPKYILNHQALRRFLDTPEDLDRWDPSMNYFTLGLIVCEDPERLNEIREDLQAKVEESIEANNYRFKMDVIIKNVRDLHFDEEVDWAISTKSADERYVYVFLAIAIMILGVACINYINMTTARSVRRAREIGLRKTFGSSKRYLIAQFMTESFITVAIAGLLGLLMVMVAIPYFNDITLKDFTIFSVFTGQLMGIFAGIILFTTFVAGIYPAFYMTKFEPALVLRGAFTQQSRSGILRKILTTVQFAISVTLIVSSVVIIKQLNMMQTSKLNEAGDQIVSIRYGGFSGPVTIAKYQVYKNELLKNPAVANVTLANHLPRLDYFGFVGMDYKVPDYSDEIHRWDRLNGDFDFPETFDMELIAGRYFENGNTADSATVILNRTAAEFLNASPEELIGKTILTPRNFQFVGGSDFADARVGTIIGVVEDFPYKSGYNEIVPLVVTPSPRNDDLIIHVKLNPGDFGEKLTFLENTWRKLYPEYGFDFWFIDQEFHRMYEQENQVADMTKVFTILAILLTCFGVYGLSSFMAQQKIKEIGIRKVLGASTGQISYIMVSLFIKLIAIASLVMIPVTGFLIYRYWLEDFSYRTSLSVEVVLLPIVVLVGITILTMGYETYKAARANPVESLKYE